MFSHKYFAGVYFAGKYYPPAYGIPHNVPTTAKELLGLTDLRMNAVIGNPYPNILERSADTMRSNYITNPAGAPFDPALNDHR